VRVRIPKEEYDRLRKELESDGWRGESLKCLIATILAIRHAPKGAKGEDSRGGGGR